MVLLRVVRGATGREEGGAAEWNTFLTVFLVLQSRKATSVTCQILGLFFVSGSSM